MIKITNITLTLLLVIPLTGCSDSNNSASSSGKRLQVQTLPCLTGKDVLPAGASVSYQIPQSDPLTTQGDGGMDFNGNFVPKEGYKVTGGALNSVLGESTYIAKFGDWAKGYSNSQKTEELGWGHCLTSGEFVVARQTMQEPPIQGNIDNYFACESLNTDLLLIKLDPAKGHRLCFVQRDGGQIFTPGFSGTKVDYNGAVVVKMDDGWYSSN